MSKQRDALFVNMSKVEFFHVFCLLLLFAAPALGNSCDSHNVHKPQCSETQMCDEGSSTCVCITGYTALNETHCTKPEAGPITPAPSEPAAPAPSSGSTVALIVVPLILVSLVIFGIYVSRKYKLASWFRRKLHQRNSTYDEFMIGHEQEDDDPPLR